MNPSFPIENCQFFTATIYQWNHLLTEEAHKNIIIDCLKFLTFNDRIELNAFVIMSNHIHLIWQPLGLHTPSSVQASFMRFTSKQLRNSMIKKNPELLSSFKVNKFDRHYQIWKREPLNIELISEKLFLQKLEYIHYNPVTARLCEKPEDYLYSSAKFYLTGKDPFGILTHFSGN